MRLRPTTNIETSVSMSLAQELEERVNPKVRMHWHEKVRGGIVLTDNKLSGDIDPAKNLVEMEKLDQFVVDIFGGCWERDWKHAQREDPKVVHFFGVGTGGAIERVARIANSHGCGLRAYDTCDAGYLNAEQAFGMIREPVDRKWRNEVFFADIEFACDRKFIQPEHSIAIVIPRVLGILDKQEVGWTRKSPKNRKMARTARKLGGLLTFTDVVLVHPYPEDNPKVVWGDTIPHPINEILGYMQEGLGNKVHASELGKVRHHTHTYTGVRIRHG